MFAAKSIRILSVIGLLLLLILQYLWFQNSYIMMEKEMKNNLLKVFSRTIELNLYNRIERLSAKIEFMNENQEDIHQDFSSTPIQGSEDINLGLQELANSMGQPCTLEGIDTLFRKGLQESLDFVPSYTLRFVSDTLYNIEEEKSFQIRQKILPNQYVEVVLDAPLGSILRQAQYILIVSLFLAILIGVILIYQLKSMLRENRFVQFIKEYTYALTHELKTPISGIYMSSAMLSSGKLEDKPDSRQRHYAICKEQSEKLLTTVERILLVAKAEHSAIVPDWQTIELMPYVEKIVQTYTNSNHRKKQIDIQYHIQPENASAQMDPVLMENVFSNLIDNAVKYSDNQVNIEIQLQCTKESTQIRIKDNGFGISEKDQKHIFDNFQRGNKMESKGIDGFGIGLNYVQKVIKAHKGNILLKSKEGVGSEFIINIPNTRI